MDDLDHLLRRRERGHHFLSDGLFLDAVNQLLDHFEVDVRLKQRHADLFQRFLNVFRRERALSAQVLERSLQFFLKILKHKIKWFLACGARGGGTGSIEYPCSQDVGRTGLKSIVTAAQASIDSGTPAQRFLLSVCARHLFRRPDSSETPA